MDSQTVSSLSGGGLGKKRGEREWTVVMRERRSEERESWPLIKRGFTEAQRKELEEQAVINRHISAGLPVPLHLLLPIWKSVASSLGPSNPTIYKHYPSFIGFILQGFDCRSVMDPEPGRCRRTDGKKWRCSRDVLSDQKYCERHIHRGRQRSRKLVEASQFASPSRVATKPEKPNGESTQSPNYNLSVSVGLQLMTPSSNDADASHRNTGKTITNGFSQKRISCVTSPLIATCTTGGTVSSAIATTNTPNTAAIASAPTVFTNIKPNQSISATVTTAFASTKTDQNTPTDAKEKHLGRNHMIQGGGNYNSSNNTVILARNVPTVLGFSPKSVLQVAGRHHGLYIGNRTSVELETGRCRRTDGKKWRCRRDVVPDQKYCPRHMHRGAKKLAKPFEPTPASSSATKTAPVHPATESRTSPNTNLCISIPSSPPPISNDEKSISSTSSDTTLSDTSISAYVISKTAS